MFTKKRGVSMLLATTLTLMLAACGSSDEGKDTGVEGESGATVLTVGTEATFAPFVYLNDGGTIVGIDREVLDAIGEEMGVEMDFKNVGWESIFSQVRNSELNLGTGGITITEERKETYDFTAPYYEATLMFVVPEDSPITTVDEIKDKKLAVQMNTTGHEAAKKLQGLTSANILAYENQAIPLQEVTNGTAEAALGDNAVVLEYLKNNPNSGLKAIGSEQFEKEYYGFMVRKGNEDVLNLLEEGLAKIKENGKLEEITGQKFD